MQSGAEDVALIEYAKLTGRPFRVFNIDTGRLNPDTYRFFDGVEKRYGIRIEYMFPDARCALCPMVPFLPAEKLAGSGVKVAKFRADGEEKEYAMTELQLGSFPAILFFPKHYSSEKRDVGSLTAFVYALR
ncbi:hypothetical protein V6N11_044609 [Hibiscus sabdariffa]|uniref:Uncharacterized protein n=2 Tax=Hibiscus sabdariffa TaxID=183260 RepID=A0ABR2NBY1_9ROSI